jgi:hypothetical protein
MLIREDVKTLCRQVTFSFFCTKSVSAKVDEEMELLSHHKISQLN